MSKYRRHTESLSHRRFQECLASTEDDGITDTDAAQQTDSIMDSIDPEDDHGSCTESETEESDHPYEKYSDEVLYPLDK